MYGFLHGHMLPSLLGIYLGVYTPRSKYAVPYSMTGRLDGKQQKLPLTLRSKEEIISRVVEASRRHEAETDGLGLENGT